MRPAREGGSFQEISSHLQGRLMQSSHGSKGGDTRMLILLARETNTLSRDDLQ